MATPDASVALAGNTYVELANFIDAQDHPSVFTVVNLNEQVLPGDPVNANVEVLVDPIHPAARAVANGSVPGAVDGVVILPSTEKDFINWGGRIRRVFARSSSATCAHGVTGVMGG